MREVLEILRNAARLLREFEETTGFKTTVPANTAKVYLAHGAIKLVQAKLHLLARKEEEPCEKS